VQKNHPTAGRITGGATVERSVIFDLATVGTFRLLLRESDFATASRIAEAVNGHLGSAAAVAEDAGAVRIVPPESLRNSPVELIAAIEALEVRPEVEAKVVVSEKTGTVVMGADVRISKVALAHGNLTIEVATDYEVSQPLPLTEGGETVVVPQREVQAAEGPNQVLTLDEGISVGELVDALNVLGVSARDMIAIFEAMRAAGALHAELVIL
jgi:flagellar P-ring protein precursor FlgI